MNEDDLKSIVEQITQQEELEVSVSNLANVVAVFYNRLIGNGIEVEPATSITCMYLKSLTVKNKLGFLPAAESYLDNVIIAY